MSIPDNERFEWFLMGCSARRAADGQPFVVIKDEYGSDRNGELRQPLFLVHPASELSLNAVLKCVSDSLKSASCLVTDRVAISALAMALSCKPAETETVSHLNEFLVRTNSTKLMQRVVIPGIPRPGYELPLGSYFIRPFSAEKILYWANRCGSAFPIDLREFNGQGSLEREPLELTILDCQQFEYTCDTDDVVSLVDGYYAAVAQAYADRISDEVKKELLVLQSAALVWIDVAELLDQMFVRIVSLFTWNDGGRTAGWATFTSRSVLHANFTPPEVLSASRQWLSTELGFTALSETKPIDRTIGTFCRFLHSAQSHRLAGRPDEALLQFVVALDLLFGIQGRSSESVATNAAVLVHRQFNKSIGDAAKAIKKLYDSRSRYLHTGAAVSDLDLAEAEKIATEVLWALLATSGRGEYDNIDEWLKTIGYIFATLSSGRVVDEREFESVGVPKSGSHRNPPNRVRSHRPT